MVLTSQSNTPCRSDELNTVRRRKPSTFDVTVKSFVEPLIYTAIEKFPSIEDNAIFMALSWRTLKDEELQRELMQSQRFTAAEEMQSQRVTADEERSMFEKAYKEARYQLRTDPTNLSAATPQECRSQSKFSIVRRPVYFRRKLLVKS